MLSDHFLVGPRVGLGGSPHFFSPAHQGWLAKCGVFERQVSFHSTSIGIVPRLVMGD